MSASVTTSGGRKRRVTTRTEPMRKTDDVVEALPVKPIIVYGYYRLDQTSGDEYVDLDTVSYERHGALTRRRSGDLRREWAARNPARRLARFDLREVE